MRQQKRKIQFINLAEQLAVQNNIVDQTMNSLLDFVSQSDNAPQRSDWDEIRKTAEQTAESISEPSVESPGRVPRPKLRRTGSPSTEKQV